MASEGDPLCAFAVVPTHPRRCMNTWAFVAALSRFMLLSERHAL